MDGDKSIPNSIGHHKEWIEAIKTGGTTTCNFDYSGALTEAVLLGVVSYRVGKPLEWDAKTLQAKGVREADPLIQEGVSEGVGGVTPDVAMGWCTVVKRGLGEEDCPCP